MQKLEAFGRPAPHRRSALVAEPGNGWASEAGICKNGMLRFRLYLAATLLSTLGGVLSALRTRIGPERRQPRGMATPVVSPWVSSLLLDCCRPRTRLRERRTEWCLLADATALGAATPGEQ
jgi:hypothetical protein